MLFGWNAAVPDVCDAEVSDLALEGVSGLSSTCWLLGHNSLGKLGLGSPAWGVLELVWRDVVVLCPYLHADVEADTALVFVGLSTP